MKDSDKDMSQLLDDLNEISSKHSLTNPSANFMNLITAIGKHANIQRLIKESTDKQSIRLEKLTWAVTALTLIATIATIIAAFK